VGEGGDNIEGHGKVGRLMRPESDDAVITFWSPVNLSTGAAAAKGVEAGFRRVLDEVGMS